MAKILVSWMATVHDFVKGTGAINENGPTSLLHKEFYDGYDFHVLLTSAKSPMDDTPYQLLVSHLRKKHGHKIVEVAMNINRSDLINFTEISKVVNVMLVTKFKQDEIDIFISPGTPAMQMAWYLAHVSLGLKTSLFQTVKPTDAKSAKSQQIWLTAEQSGYIASLLNKEAISTQSADVSDKSIVGLLKPIYNTASKIALSDVSVLITGATGTGKELLAKHIHDSSLRSKESFVAINCAAFRNDLLESRLFGHVEGAFTGALKTTKGLFHEANGGTIFLDEIGDISPYMQQTLLRVLAKDEIMRVGSNKVETVNVRVLAATNKDIYGMSMNNEFRADLYYRLATRELHLPSLEQYSLKEKEEMFAYVWQRAKNIFKENVDPKISAIIRKQLMAYNYPGNIREMENIIYGIWAENENNVKQSQLPKRLLNPNKANSLKLADVMESHVRKVYNSTGNNISKTAEILDVSQNTVRSKINLNPY